MNDDALHELLNQADERFRRAGPVCDDRASAALISSVRRRRARKTRRHTTLGVLAVLLMAAGISAWSLNAGLWRPGDRDHDTLAAKAENESPHQANPGLPAEAIELPDGATEPLDARFRADEIARLQAEIAKLEAEANRALRFVELYQAAETRRERLAAAEAELAEPLLSPRALADLEIDRAAAITIISADAQAEQFNRPAEAAESYRSVLKHFPHSRWATVAQQRLVQFEHMN